jgi:hypothetical protein
MSLTRDNVAFASAFGFTLLLDAGVDAAGEVSLALLYTSPVNFLMAVCTSKLMR